MSRRNRTNGDDRKAEKAGSDVWTGPAKGGGGGSFAMVEGSTSSVISSTGALGTGIAAFLPVGRS